ncbi:hypothetical protein Y032_0085g1841 [Ancylostoma ceylanicum]|uniref:Phlebovirus glycoprotein G2 fusion domain-containing protein n=1 Tax=Ancylostoma ceylanicum TaxID=53326 RepID=A0A016TQ51_9BILA|nr:hypothetical protein Y032_0085g1841 [Ancylostoma ceylanicum]
MWIHRAARSFVRFPNHMKLWIFICCTCLAEELKTDENTCFVGEGNELKETKVPAPICRFEIEYESEQCTSKFATHYKTVQHWRTDLAMEIEGSHCTYTDTKIDCVCVGSGCNEPFSVKKILAKEIPKTRSRSKIRKLLCFMTDGDLFGNGTVIGTPAPTTTTEESELTSTQVGRTRTPFRDKDKVTEAPPKKATKPSPPKDPKMCAVTTITNTQENDQAKERDEKATKDINDILLGIKIFG